MSTNKIILIKTDKLHPHPDNPRKNIGDISELAESIKKNGVLQNLTVVPLDNSAEEYTVIIGHRRLAAAKEAELKEVPCAVTEMTAEEQFHTMLTENMQRVDLTPMEQAQGFQIMFDWGYSEKDIAEKTGFSETTIRHRLNMAKLSTKAIEQFEKNNGFQMSLSDFYALEKVPTLKEKNEILKLAHSSRDIHIRAAQAETKARRDKAYNNLVKLLKKTYPDIEPFPDRENIWNGKWEKVKSIDLDKLLPDKVTIRAAKKGEKLFFYKGYACLDIYHKKPKEEKVESEYDRQRKEQEKRGKQITAKLKQMTGRSADLIRAVIDGKVDDLPQGDTEEVKDALWQLLVSSETFLRGIKLCDFMACGDYYKLSSEDCAAVDEKVKGLSVIHQMLIMLHEEVKNVSTYSYGTTYNKEKAEMLVSFYSLLERYGWSFEDEEEAILNGTHELYTKPDSEEG